MKAAVFREYGEPEVVRIEELPKPAPRTTEVLVKVHATTVASGDARIRAMNVPRGYHFFARLMFGYFKPRLRVLGTSAVGEIEAVGSDVTRFKPGERVFACSARSGAHAEYMVLRKNDVIAPIPDGVDYSTAAVLPFGGTTALHFLDRAKLRAGESLIVNGASGAVGTAVLQIAKQRGAEITAVCSAANADLVRSLGATHVIDYSREDFTKNGHHYDVIMDNVGNLQMDACLGSLHDTGRLLLIVAGIPTTLAALLKSRQRGKRIITGVAADKAEFLQQLAERVQRGTYRPVIERTYPLAQIVEAHRLVDSGRKIGNVVIQVTPM